MVWTGQGELRLALRETNPGGKRLAGPRRQARWERKARGGPMALTLNIGKCTLLGNYRENNEDAIDVKQFADLTICLVADGMGGQAAGDIASKRATEVVPRELKKHLEGDGSPDEAKQIIRRAIVQANEDSIDMGA